MAIVNPPSFLQNIVDEEDGATAQNDRLTAGALALPGTAALSGRTGILPGPAGGVGEVTVVNNGTVRVNPFRAVIQGTRAGIQGQYVVTNDAAVDRSIGAMAAGVSRKDLVVTRVADSFYAPDTQDAGDVIVVPGNPVPSNPQEPTLGGANLGNYLVHGVLNVPPTGGNVTFTPRPSKFTVAAGGVLPVDDTDTTPGIYEGQLRRSAAKGVEEWRSGQWRAFGRAKLYRTGWANEVTRAAVNNYNMAALTVNPGFGPYVAMCSVRGAFTMADLSGGSLRITVDGEAMTYIATAVLGEDNPVANAHAMYPVLDGGARTFRANIEVLLGSFTQYSDARHSWLEVLAVPML